MDKIVLVKQAVNIIVGAGVSKVVHGFIQNNTSPAASVPQQIAIATSSVVLGMMAKEATAEFTGKKIDAIVAWWNTDVKPKLK